MQKGLNATRVTDFGIFKDELKIEEKMAFLDGYNLAYVELDNALNAFLAKVKSSVIASDVEAMDYWIMTLHQMFKTSCVLRDCTKDEYYGELLDGTIGGLHGKLGF